MCLVETGVEGRDCHCPCFHAESQTDEDAVLHVDAVADVKRYNDGLQLHVKI